MFAIAVDLGSVSPVMSDSVTWALSLVRNPTVKYVGPDGTTQSRSPYWVSQFDSSQDAVSGGNIVTEPSIT